MSAQVALSLVALVGAGLFLRSLQHAQQISPGFDTEHLAVLSFDLGAQGYTEERGRQFQQRVLERAASVPGVQAASVASTVPLFAGGFARTVFLEGQDASDRRAGRLVQISVVGSRYLETVGIPLLRGRTLSETDQPNTPIAVVVNETMAKRFWPDQDAIGKRFKFFGQDFFNQVVGIAKDSKYNFIGEDETPFIYQATTQVYQPQLSLFVKAAQPSAVLGTVRGEVQQLDRNLPLTERVHAVGDLRSGAVGAADGRVAPRRVRRAVARALRHRHLRRDGVRREPADARAGHPHGARREPRRRPPARRECRGCG